MAADQTGSSTVRIAQLEAQITDLEDRLSQARADLSVRGIAAEAGVWRTLDALSHGVALFDSKNRLVRCNACFAQPFVFHPDFGPGMTHDELLDMFMNAKLVDMGGLDPVEWRDRMRARWTQPRPEDMVVDLVDGRAVQLIDRRDSAGNMICLVNNVTALRQAESRLRATQERAEAASRAKSAFLANMSHEIRTPMNGVVGMADLLIETDLTEEQRLFVSTIKSSGEALLVIINDVLDYSKIEANRMILHPEPFELERVVHDLVLLMQPAAQKKGVTLLVDYDMFLPSRLVGDAGRIRQILTNLLGNAVKFTQEGYVLIRVVGIEMEEGLASIHVTVEDTGIGIPEDARDDVFGTFNQVDNAAHRNIGGTGLGLSISKRLVDMMGGEIWVDSEEGKGSCFGFKVVMPVMPDASDTPPVLPETLKRAMIVDDLEVNRQILDKQLRVLGIETVTCASGAEALERLDDSIDLVLTDQVMPGMDGVALARRIRSSGSNVPILLLSSFLGGLQLAANEAGIQAVLQNPVPRKTLFAKLKELGALNTETLRVRVQDGPAQIRRGTSGARPMRVLTAEDNMTNQLVFEKCVAALDIDLRFAVNGAEALELHESFRPDLIFMDISMPQIDGRQATAEIRSRETATGAYVPILAMTAHSVDEAERSQLTLGMDGCLTKPMRRHEIIAAIRAWQPDDTRFLDPEPDADAEESA
ncbi:response regulator [Pseudaestuariivita atlantica]|nr:response regulator [Pseudaestuariivita atlantica]